MRTRARCTHFVERAISASTSGRSGRRAASANDVVLGEARVAQQPVDDVRMRVAEEPLQRLAVGPPRERLALAERQRPPSPSSGTALLVRARSPAAAREARGDGE